MVISRKGEADPDVLEKQMLPRLPKADLIPLLSTSIVNCLLHVLTLQLFFIDGSFGSQLLLASLCTN